MSRRSRHPALFRPRASSIPWSSDIRHLCVSTLPLLGRQSSSCLPAAVLHSRAVIVYAVSPLMFESCPASYLGKNCIAVSIRIFILVDAFPPYHTRPSIFAIEPFSLMRRVCSASRFHGLTSRPPEGMLYVPRFRHGWAPHVSVAYPVGTSRQRSSSCKVIHYFVSAAVHRCSEHPALDASAQALLLRL